MKKVTLCYIRSLRLSSKKIPLDEAIDMIKADRSHSKYTRQAIKKAIEKGVRIQLVNHTLQMIGVGFDSVLTRES